MICSDPNCIMVWWDLYDRQKNWLGQRHSHTPEDANLQLVEETNKEAYYVEEESK